MGDDRRDWMLSFINQVLVNGSEYGQIICCTLLQRQYVKVNMQEVDEK